MKENLFLQTHLNYINNQKRKQTKKEHTRLVSVEVDVSLLVFISGRCVYWGCYGCQNR